MGQVWYMHASSFCQMLAFLFQNLGQKYRSGEEMYYYAGYNVHAQKLSSKCLNVLAPKLYHGKLTNSTRLLFCEKSYFLL